MICQKCQKHTSPRRSRRITGTAGGNHKHDDIILCLPCHAIVFDECDGKEWPQLFDPRMPWQDEFSEWLDSGDLGALVGTSSRGFATWWSAGEGVVLGIEFERQWVEESRRWIYRGVSHAKV